MKTATLQSSDEEAASGATVCNDATHFRPPVLEDGPAVHALVRACPPLDVNSAYCNLIQCAHFAGTCVIAADDRGPAGWISAYRPPEEPDALFVWQVAVHPRARGRGLALAMLDDLFARAICRDVRWLKTTITPDNTASWALFNRFAAARGAALNAQPWLHAGVHLPDALKSEHLVTIGPLGGSARLC